MIFLVMENKASHISRNNDQDGEHVAFIHDSSQERAPRSRRIVIYYLPYRY